jgi:hypothetical protein
MDADGDAVPYYELLGLARDEGLIALDVHVIQAPGEANGYTAVVQATARTQEGGFAAVGETSAASTPPEWHPFLLTLAELRAKARALRELTGLEHTVREELATPYLPADVPASGSSGDRRPAPGSPGTRAADAARSGATGDSLRAHGPAEPASGSEGQLQAPPSTGGSRGAARAAGPEGNGTAATPAPRPTPTATVSSPGGDVAGEANGADQETHPDAVTAPHPAVAPEPAPAAPTRARDEPDGEGIDKEMEAKLLKLAISIAALEGTELSDAEARQKLDDFFLRAFKRPLNRATRIEGQRVVQRLSSELSRLRTASHDAKA